MDPGPPPLFNQGVSARARLAFFAFLAIALIIVDDRVRALDTLRIGVGVVLSPVQRALLLPRDALAALGSYFSSSARLQQENTELRRQVVQQSQQAMQAGALAADNERLRRLLGAREQVAAGAVLARVLYESRDRFSHKLVLDRGANDGLQPGQPVIDDRGVIGQLTRVFPASAEMTLLIDKEQSIPVMLMRNGLRGVVFGTGEALSLRFMASTADIQEGDVAVTSGIDGLYPPGYPVGKVERIDRADRDMFATVKLSPSAGVIQHADVLVLLTQPPARTELPAAARAGAAK
jgi:rod shape-determining protein MreC